MSGPHSRQSDQLGSDLQAAFNLLRDFVDLREVDATFPLRSNAVYTNWIIDLVDGVTANDSGPNTRIHGQTIARIRLRLAPEE